MKFILDAKLVFCGNLPNILGVFLKEESENPSVPVSPLFFIKFIFRIQLVAYVSNFDVFCV